MPELDNQISQNEATLVQLKAALEAAEANLDLAEVTWGRDRPLVRDGWVTQQQGTVDVDTVKARKAAVNVAQANVAAQENQLKVLHQERDYASVIAPFDGVITKRNVEVGSLVQGNATSGTFMFTIMQSDVMRVWVYVPQDSAFGLAPGVDAAVRVPEIPGRTFSGKVTRIARALETSTRTLLTEIDISNPDGALQPGAYCIVQLDIVHAQAQSQRPDRTRGSTIHKGSRRERKCANQTRKRRPEMIAVPTSPPAPVGQQGPPARAAASAVRALRVARGSLLLTTGTASRGA